MNLPKLQRVEESDLQRVELQQTFDEVPSSSTNLDRTILVNELILDGLSNVLLKNLNKELEPIIISKIQEVNETLGEQRLSLQLLRLLEITNGDKTQAAQWLREKLNFNERNF